MHTVQEGQEDKSGRAKPVIDHPSLLGYLTDTLHTVQLVNDLDILIFWDFRKNKALADSPETPCCTLKGMGEL